MKRLTLILALIVLMAQPVLAMLPASCDEFLAGGSQDRGYNCVLAVISHYENSGLWNGGWDQGGYGWYPPN
jgi:hypothetical protein